ncbi:V-type ATP synthase subunit I [candidate division WOR-3 bacterium]|nr:V-type ATP synthase subunit I [candidate division WOR-3 bacterium]
MAIERVSKVAIVIHQSKKAEFLTKLQQLGILHIVRIAESDGEKRFADEEGNLNQILGTIELLDSLQDKKKAKGKVLLDRMEYERIATEFDIEKRIKEIQRLTTKRQELESRLKFLEEEINRLKPWENLKHSVAEFGSFTSVKVLLGKFPTRQEYLDARSALGEKLAVMEEVGETRGTVFAVVLVYREALEDVTAILNNRHWENVEMKDESRLPADVIRDRQREQEQIKSAYEEVEKEIARYAAELPQLKARADAIINQIKRLEAESRALWTDSALIIYGWIRERDYKKLVRLVEEMKTAVVTRVQPEPGEEPPVALVNRRLWKPFELVLELYQLPLPNELDPTWLIAPFFGVFFALCLTDAGYGIIVALAALLLMRKMGMDNKLLGIILIGGLLTIPAGALVGGWFGDLPDRLGISWLVDLKNKFLWFDPMKEPMKFFVLSLALGYLQLIAGIAFEIADCIRVKNYGEAFLGQLPWFLFINSLVSRLILMRSLPVWVSSLLLIVTLLSVAGIVVWTRREKETMVSQTLWFFLIAGLLVSIAARLGWLPEELLLVRWVVLGLFFIMSGYAIYSILHQILIKQGGQRGRLQWLPLLLGIGTIVTIVLYFLKTLPAIVPGLFGTAFYFFAPVGKRLLKKFVWGSYALYGATSYIGVLLSYIRLMALGMCTGGVAMAINVIAWMVVRVPVVGVLMALIVLVIGHTYNIAVNVLGAFVHSLRLQYVEFFPRFYTGGGEPFVPFKEVHQFVTWKS